MLTVFQLTPIPSEDLKVGVVKLARVLEGRQNETWREESVQDPAAPTRWETCRRRTFHAALVRLDLARALLLYFARLLPAQQTTNLVLQLGDPEVLRLLLRAQGPIIGGQNVFV